MQIRVITLDHSSPLVSELKTIFPKADVQVQRAIDLRSTSTDVLVASGSITREAQDHILHGRRRHQDIPSTGAVGLAHANRLALEESFHEPLLLLEEDCVIASGERLKRDIDHLLLHQDKFDLASFGVIYRGKKEAKDWLPLGFAELKDKFWLLHCALYTPRGRERISTVLRRTLPMQIDSLYGSMAKEEKLVVVASFKWDTVYQRLHRSTVQVFDVPSEHKIRTGFVFFVLGLCLALCIYTRYRR